MNRESFPWPVVDAGGDAYSRGRQHGAAVPALIRRNIAAYEELVAYNTGLDGAAMRRKAARYLDAVAAYDDELAAEIRGIAAGAGLEPVDVMILNCRTELLATVPLHECTSLALLPPATAAGQVWLAQNWDWLVALSGGIVLLRLRGSDRPDLTMLVEAGQIGKTGLNSAGVGLAINWLETTYHQVGVPFIVLCRIALNQPSLGAALNALSVAPRATAGNYMLASADGVAVNLEVRPDAVAFQEPENGVLVHSNHFLAPHFQVDDHGLFDEGFGSVVRRQRALALLAAAPRPLGRAAIESVLADVACAPYSICAAPRPDRHPLDQSTTQAAVIMDLAAGTMSVAPGRPVAVGYVTV